MIAAYSKKQTNGHKPQITQLVFGEKNYQCAQTSKNQL